MQCAFQRAYAVAQADQAARFEPGLGTAHPVIAYLDRAPVVLGCHSHPGGAGARVLDYVGERFGAEEVDARLDWLGESLVGDVQVDGNGKPAGEGVEGGGETAMGQDRGVDARSDLAQAVDAATGVTERMVEGFLRLLRRG